LIVDLLLVDLLSARRRRAAKIHAPEKIPRPTAPRNDSTFIRQLLVVLPIGRNFLSPGLMDGQSRQ
jgi:hypothetical protein